MKAFRSALGCTAAFLVIFGNICMAQEWYVSYENGKDALRNKRWQEAIRHFNAAIQARSRSEAKVKTTGLHFIDYFPYLYRGEAYYNLQDFVHAREDFEREEKAGQVDNAYDDNEASGLLKNRLAALRTVLASDAKFQEGKRLFEQRKFAEAIKQFQLVDANSPNYQAAQDYISTAKNELARSAPAVTEKTEKTRNEQPEKPKRDLVKEEFSEGVRLYNQNDLEGASAKFNAVLRMSANHREALNYLGRIRAARKRLAIAEKKSVTPPTKPVQEAEPPATHVNEQEVALNEAVGLFTAGKLLEAKPKFRALQQSNASMPSVTAYLDTITRVEDLAKKGIAAFYDGEYQRSIDELAEASKRESDNIHIFAFLGCAYASQYYLTGAENRDLEQSAMEAFRRVKQLDPNYKIDSRWYISPRLIAFFNGH
jgi:TolA-binding protein